MKIGLFIFGTDSQINVIKQTVSEYQNYKKFKLKVYCPDKFYDIFRSALACYKVDVLKDSSLDCGFLFRDKIKKQLEQYKCHDRIGWYFQQYLKIRAVEDSSYRLVVVLDGDTFLEPDYLVRSIENKRLAATLEYVDKYNKLLTDFFKIDVRNKKSFIANFGIIDRDLLISTVGFVSNYFQSALDRVFNNDSKFNFSEYQLFANLMLSVGWKAQNYKFYRRADLLLFLFSYQTIFKIVSWRGYDAFAFELDHNRSFIKSVGAVVCLMIGLTW